MKAVYMVCHLRAPVGHWFRVCGGQVNTFRSGDRFVFTHASERRS